MRSQVFNFIVFAQINAKYYYNKKHLSMFLKIDNYVLLRLYREYNIFFIKYLDSKLSQQFVDLFRIIKKID